MPCFLTNDQEVIEACYPSLYKYIVVKMVDVKLSKIERARSKVHNTRQDELFCKQY